MKQKDNIKFDMEIAIKALHEVMDLSGQGCTLTH
jgi:hypothetical protein